MNFNDDEFVRHSQLICSSYEKSTGKLLLTESDLSSIPLLLYEAPFVLVTHNMAQDPIFNYANLSAQNLWGYSWDEFISIPSRLSAEPILKNEREQLLKKVQEKGYIDNYEGVRISKTLQRFVIKNATIWNLTDQSNRYLGQAAMFKAWSFL